MILMLFLSIFSSPIFFQYPITINFILYLILIMYFIYEYVYVKYRFRFIIFFILFMSLNSIIVFGVGSGCDDMLINFGIICFHFIVPMLIDFCFGIIVLSISILFCFSLHYYCQFRSINKIKDDNIYVETKQSDFK